MNVLVGTSGWQYDSWRGRLYPRDLPHRAWLEHYAERFPTVEVNNSFYRLPSAEVFEQWRRRVPAGFCYAVKGNRFITHIKRLKDPSETVATFWERARLLGPKLGPMLWQLPPTFKADVPRLRDFLFALPRSMQAAVEFRHDSWHRDDVYALLDEHRAAFVLPDKPGARVPNVTTGGWAYVRFHQGTRVGPDYTRRKLRQWADRIASLPAGHVFVYFNNDPGGAAVRDAATMMDLLDERGLVVPRAALAERRPA